MEREVWEAGRGWEAGEVARVWGGADSPPGNPHRGG